MLNVVLPSTLFALLHVVDGQAVAAGQNGSTEGERFGLAVPTTMPEPTIAITGLAEARRLSDTTPPVLSVIATTPYVTHVMVTVQLNEDGTVYCGALDDTSGGAYAPSSYQLRTGSGLNGKGQTSVTSGVQNLVLVRPLLPSTKYDVYCYAEDLMVNGISIASISATKQNDIVTASGPPPPVLTISGIDAYINHVKLTLQLSRDGVVYCGAVDDTSGSAVAPSAYQLRYEIDLDGKGQLSVTESISSLLVVSSLLPSTTYDIFCYAEDTNGIGIADVLVTKQNDIVTASGGDYVAPVISYIEPFSEIDNQEITLHVKMSEDGRVWCVIRLDRQLYYNDTSVPSVSEVKTGENMDAWASQPITAANNYRARMQLGGLVEGATYEAYCFGEDMSGNGMDGTPAFPADPNSVANSKFPYPLTTLTHLNATQLYVTSVRDGASQQYWAEPATWNLQLPRYQIHGGQRREHVESWNMPLELSGVILRHAPKSAHGCKKLPAAPFGPSSVALVRRGGCEFFEKARRAHASGHVGLLIVDSRDDLVFGYLPEVTANDNDPLVPIPSWIVRHGDGEWMINAITGGAILSLEVQDVHRKPRLGMRQKDMFGLRHYVSH